MSESGPETSIRGFLNKIIKGFGKVTNMDKLSPSDAAAAYGPPGSLPPEQRAQVVEKAMPQTPTPKKV